MTELTFDALQKIPHGRFIFDANLASICKHYATFYIRYVETLEVHVSHADFYDSEEMEVYDFDCYLKYELHKHELASTAAYLLTTTGLKLVPTQFAFACEEEEGKQREGDKD